MRNSTIRLITVVAAVVVLGIIALIGLATGHSNAGNIGSTVQDGSTAVPSAAPATHAASSGSATATCQVGWFRLSGGYSTGAFHAGTVSASSQTKGSAYQATLPSNVTADWINVTFHLASGKKAGSQTTTLNVPQTGGTWSDLLVPDEALGNDPGVGWQAPPGTTCQVTTWGNASG